MSGKKCRICKNDRPLSCFNKSINSKDGLDGRCRDCYIAYRKANYIKTKELRSAYERRITTVYPWIRRYQGIKDRCNNPRSKDYRKYGGRGIKLLMTAEDIKFLWFRDKAYEMDKPHIDRIDNNGHYEISNCHFLPLRVHAKKSMESLLKRGIYPDRYRKCIRLKQRIWQQEREKK